MSATMRRAALYVRVSSEEQVAGYSLSAQERAAETHCRHQGWEIVASYRAAVADDTIDTDQLRRLTLARACDAPIMMSALNRGATHRARYTDLNGHVAEVVISAKDCEP